MGKEARALARSIALLVVLSFGVDATLGAPATTEAARKASEMRVDRYGDALPPGAISRIGTIRRREGGVVSALAFSPDSHRVASVSNGSVSIWDVADGRLLLELPNVAAAPVIQYSPDGSLLAVIGVQPPQPGGGPPGGWGNPAAAGSLRLFSASDGKPMKSPAVQSVSSFRFSADGRRIIAGDVGGNLRVLDVQSGAELALLADAKEFRGNISTATRVAISPDGATAAGVHGNGHGDRLFVWDVASKSLRLATLELRGGCLDLSFSPDSRTLTMLYDVRDGQGYSNTAPDTAGSVRTLDVTPGKPLDKASLPERRHDGVARMPVTALLSPDGKRFAVRSRIGSYNSDFSSVGVHLDSELKLHDIAGGKTLPLGGPMHDVRALAFSPDGAWLASGGTDGEVTLWSTTDGKPVAPKGAESEPAGALHAVAISADNRLVAVGGVDRTIRVVDLAGGKVSTLVGHENTVLALAFSPDSSALASVSHDKTIRLWDLTTGRQAQKLSLVAHWAARQCSLAWSADGKFLGLANGAGMVAYDLITLRMVGSLDDDRRHELARLLQFHGVDRMLGGGGVEGVSITGKTSGTPGLQRVIEWAAAVLSPDGKQIAAAQTDTLQIVDAESLSDLTRLAPKADFQADRPRKHFRHVVWSSDGAKIFAVQDPIPWGGWRGMHGDPNLVGQPGQRIRAWSADGRELGELAGQAGGHRGPISAITLSVDGKRLVTASRDGTALVWDTASLAPPMAQLAGDRTGLWKTAIGDDAESAADAMRALAGKPADALAAVREYLASPPEGSETSETPNLIRQLDDPSIVARVKTINRLARLRSDDPATEGLLLRHVLSPDGSETSRQRAADVLGGMTGKSIELTRLERTIHILEWTVANAGADAAANDAQALLGRLARLPAQRGGTAAIAALGRLSSGATRNQLASLPVSTPGAATRPGASVPTTRPTVSLPTTRPAVAVAPVTPPGPATRPATAPVTPPRVAESTPKKPLVPPISPSGPSLVDVVDARPLPAGAIARFGGPGMTHAAKIESVSTSTDGRRMATASADQQVRVFELPGGNEIRRFAGGIKAASASLSPDGKRLAALTPVERDTVNHDFYDALAVWEVDSGKMLWQATLANGGFTGVAFSPDGTKVVAMDEDHVLRVYGAAQGGEPSTVIDPNAPDQDAPKPTDAKAAAVAARERQLQNLTRVYQRTRTILFAQDGNRVLTAHDMGRAGSPGIVAYWDLKGAKRIFLSPQWGRGGPFGAVGLTRDGGIIALVRKQDNDRSASPADAAKEKQVKFIDLFSTWGANARQMTLFAVSPDGQLAVVAETGRADEAGPAQILLTLHDVATGGARQRYGPLPFPSSVAFSSDGRTLIAAGTTVRLFDVQSGKSVGPAPSSPATAIAVSPDGATLAIGGADGVITLRAASGGKILQRVTAHNAEVTALSFTKAGDKLASVGADLQLRQWTTKNLGPIGPEMKTQLRTVQRAALAWSPDSSLLAVNCDGGGTVFDTRTGASKFSLGHGFGGGHVAGMVRFDGASRVIAPSGDGGYDVWLVETGRPIPRGSRNNGGTRYSSSDLSPNGRLAATRFIRGNFDDTTVLLWDHDSGLPVNALLTKTPLETAVAESQNRVTRFTPDGSRVVVVRDAREHQPHLRKPVAAANGAHQIVHVWDVASGDELSMFSGHDAPVRSVAFSSASDVMYTASEDGTVLAWKLPVTQVAAEGLPALDPLALAESLAGEGAAKLPAGGLTKSTTLNSIRSSYRVSRALAESPEKAIAAFDAFYKVSGANDDAEVAEVVQKLGPANDGELGTLTRTLIEVQSSNSKAERPLVRAALDPAGSPALREGAKLALGRINARTESVRLAAFVRAFEMAKGNPAARQKLQWMADNLPARTGGNLARRALGQPMVEPEHSGTPIKRGANPPP